MFALLLTVSLFFQENNRDVYPGYSALDSAVAISGTDTLTLNQFRIAYLEVLKHPAFKESPDLREAVLMDQMKIQALASEARRLQLDTTRQYQFRMEAYQKNLIRKAHYHHHIAPRLSFTEKDVEEAYRFTQESRLISHLFFKTKEDAGQAFEELNQGAEFDSLARHIFRSGKLAENGGDLGWVDWRDLDYELAMAAFRTKAGFITRPVRSQFGWHILKIRDYKKRPLITRFEYEQKRENADYLLREKRGEHLAFLYLDSLIKSAEVTINPVTARDLEDWYWPVLNQKAAKGSDQSFQMEPTGEFSQHLHIRDRQNEVLATLNGQAFTVADFLQTVPFIPASAWQSDFKTVLDLVFRDELVYREALQTGAKSKTHHLEMKLASDRVLASSIRPVILNGVTVNPDDIGKWLSKNQMALTGASEDSLLISMVRGTVLAEKKQMAEEAFLKQIGFTGSAIFFPERVHRFYNRVTRSPEREAINP